MARRRLLWDPETERRWLVPLDGAGPRKIAGLGVFDPARADEPDGTTVDAAGKRLIVLTPTPEDLHATIRRKAQRVGTKDAGRILVQLGIRAGDHVFESGIGSAAMTTLLAEAVGPDGRVDVQELREDFRDWGQQNLAAAGLDDRVHIHLGDACEGIVDEAAGPFDAAFLDLPEPWRVVPHLKGRLKAGGRVAAFCPQAVQMDQTVRALRAEGFAAIHAMELIERAWEVKERGSRPSFDGLGHTAFLTFARWPGGTDD